MLHIISHQHPLFVKTLPYNALIINFPLLFDEIVDKTFVNESRFGTRLLFFVNIFAKSIRFREPLTVQ